MKNNRQKGITFQLGTFDEKKSKCHIITTLYKKSRVAPRANLILQREGQVWLRINYGYHKNTWNKKVMFYNDGIYKTTKDIREVLTLFIEQNLINYLQSD